MKYISLILIGISLPFVLWSICDILPTFDDFTTLQSPQFTSIWSKELLPNDSFWRPFDFLFGCLLGWNTSLFPTLNHIIIILGHTINTLLVYLICRKLNINNVAINIATLFFFFSPASLGATLACDGLNQTYAQCWGLTATYCFLTTAGKQRILLWGLCIMMAALSKENGLAWAVLPPIIAYAFNQLDKRKAIQYFSIGMGFAFTYFLLRLSLKVSDSINDEYIESTLADHLKDLIQIIVYNWLPIDYMSLLYIPERNWVFVGITLAASIPFLLLLFIKNVSIWKDKTFILLVACFFIVASPHLITLVSIMHNYAPLSITAIIIAYLVSKIPADKWLITAFSLFLAAAFITDIHHTTNALNSGYLGKKMAMEAIKQTNKPVTHAYVINIDDYTTPKYSSFAVRPIDAFAWGLSVRHYNNYAWPIHIKDTTLYSTEDVLIKKITDSVMNAGFQHVWIVSNKGNKVISVP